MPESSFEKSALQTIAIEKEAVSALEQRIGDSYVKACELIMACPGRVIVTGMGKSGHIANKIAATLASTGTPAFFVHPGEASHGDLGMITRDDIVIAISSSGSTSELLTLLPMLARQKIPLLAMTGNPSSPLAQAAEAVLDISVESEACPLGLAPTSSTTVTLVMGDALAVSLLEARGFSAEDFAFSHPGGALGRKLLLKVKDVMHSGDQIPVVASGTPLKDALFEVSTKGLGMTTINDAQGKLLGVFTDGDLRRCLDDSLDLDQTPIDTIMTRNGQTVSADMLAAEALGIMEEKKITSVVVVDEQQQVAGVVHLHDLLKAGLA